MLCRSIICGAVLALVTLTPAPRPQGLPAHAIANINDSRSHGQLRDGFLSLNEAIRLHNRQLTFNDLSPAEQAQIFGTQDVAWADIDVTVVPTITFEADLEVIANWPHGLVIGGANGRPILDIGSTRGIVADSDFCDFRNLIVRGGTVGVTVTQHDTFYGSVFENVRFEGQTQAGVVMELRDDDGETQLGIENCVFDRLPVGFRLDDVGNRRTGRIWMRGGEFIGGGDGFRCNLGPGGSYTLLLERTRFTNLSGTGLALLRGAAADRAIIVDCADLVSSGVATGLTIDGHPSGLTDAQLRMVDLSASGVALRVGGAGSNTSVRVLDSRLRGGVQLATTAGSVGIENCRTSGGQVTIGSAAGSVQVTETISRGSAISSTGGATVSLTDSLLDGGSLAGTATAPIVMQRCHVSGGTTVGSNVTNGSPVPAPQLGDCDVSPLNPPIGSLVNLDTDLPPRLAGVWLFGLGVDTPSVVQGRRLYMSAATLAVWPAVYRGQNRALFPIPPVIALRGLTMVFQLVVGKDPGFQAPYLTVPPGRRISLR